jgi:predicted nucleotidyltransferase component of viral defense system
VATRLIFAGGTGLSKAHRLIERMSEDIDIKVMLEEAPDGYTLKQGVRGRLREMGYMLDQFVERETPHRFSMTCITVAETLAEKVLSMLRRCAWNWDGHYGLAIAGNRYPESE